MAVPGDKAALLAAIDDTYTKLLRDLATVPADRREDATLDGHADGTRMSVGDLVSYLVGWNELFLKWCDRRDAGQPVAMPEEGFGWNDLGGLAQKFYGDYADLAWQERLDRLDRAKKALVARIEAADAATLFTDPWYKTYPLGRMAHWNSAAPYANARNRLRRWKKAQGLL
ncbi:MAG: ClbS/DfsB family four-helix bundle protein [Caenispirillum bisanense]|nr:ClbS/DfsB family four-helix bundle protein [Caenispirillum bisanense]MCA1973457.1 ClbS/DfsB family four-helix bundle protein [Caenispirillum sp.]